MVVLQQGKHIVTVRPSTSAPGYIPNRNENVCPPRNICIQMFIAALCITVQLLQLVIIAKRGKKPRHPSVDEWINKVWPVHTMEYFSAIKRNGEFVEEMEPAHHLFVVVDTQLYEFVKTCRTGHKKE